MSAGTEWSHQPTQVTSPRTLEVTEPVDAVNVRVVNGTVNVVGTTDGGPARLEISEAARPAADRLVHRRHTLDRL